VGNASAASPIYVSTHGNNSWNGQNSTWINGTLNGPKATIKNATGTVPSGGTIYIAKGTYNENNITINRNMTIIGANQDHTIINGNHINTIFFIPYGVNVTIRDLTLTNANSTHNGGAILNRGTFTVDGSTFRDNSATDMIYGGGAICNYQEATLTVNNCTFTNNTAINGAGGAIYNWDTNCTLSDSTFTNNTALEGGAIGNGGTLIVNKSYFINNTVTGTQVVGGLGGAIYSHSGNLDVTDSTFKNNYAMNYGGAIYNGGTLNIKGSIFTNNTAYGGAGGAIYGNNITITNSTFNANTEKGHNGGAISGNNSIITGCIFKDNNAGQYGPTIGGAISGSNDSITDSSFIGNTVYGIGGAIAIGGNSTVTGCTFTNNSATDQDSSTSCGGAICTNGNLTVKRCTFSINNANYGGAIENEGNLTVTGSTFISNNATDGGAIYNIGDAVAHFNQIVGNTAKIGNDIYNNPGGKVNAILNWWGFNLGVNIAKQIYNPANGTVNYNPWIILTITASPTSVNVGGNSTITAELLYSSNGSKVVYQNPKYGVVPYTGYADFKTNDGAIKNVKFVNGKATSTLTDLKTAGVAKVSATVDNLTLTKSVDVKTS
jgi:predicted outer membrane repeat protein